MNRGIEVLTKVKTLLKEYPELYNQMYWGFKGDPRDCGTPCCIFGWCKSVLKSDYGVDVKLTEDVEREFNLKVKSLNDLFWNGTEEPAWTNLNYFSTDCSLKKVDMACTAIDRVIAREWPEEWVQLQAEKKAKLDAELIEVGDYCTKKQESEV